MLQGRRGKMKIFRILIIICLLIIIPGCSQQINKSDDGKLISLSFKDLDQTGFYVLESENTIIHPLYRDGMSFRGEPEIPTNGNPVLVGRYIWLVNEDQLIPVVKKGKTELIYFDNTNQINKDITLEKFQDTGYTLGTSFSEITDSDYLGLNEVTINKFSQAGKTISTEQNRNAFILTQINNVPLKKNILDANGIITGLQENGKYILTGYKGTQYVELTFIADTHYLISNDFITVPKMQAYILSQKGYAVIDLPKDLESGYYLVNGTGLFFYDAEPLESTTSSQESEIRATTSASDAPLTSDDFKAALESNIKVDTD